MKPHLVILATATAVVLTGAGVTARIALTQLPPPELGWVPAEQPLAPPDEDVFDFFAARGTVEIAFAPGGMVAPFDLAAELLELFVAFDESADAAIAHASPVIRAYVAFHVTRDAPQRVARLRSLLVDPSEVTVAFRPEAPRTTTLAALTVAMLCARAADAEEIRRFLQNVRHDPELLKVRTPVRTCLEGLGGEAWSARAAAGDVLAQMLDAAGLI